MTEPVWHLSVDPQKAFAIRWQNHEHWIDFEIHEIAGNDGEADVYADDRHDNGMQAFEHPSYKPIEGGHVMHGTLKFDGCLQLQQTNTDCMMHFCDFDKAEPQLIRALKMVAALGPQMISWMGQ